MNSFRTKAMSSETKHCISKHVEDFASINVYTGYKQCISEKFCFSQSTCKRSSKFSMQWECTTPSY